MSDSITLVSSAAAIVSAVIAFLALRHLQAAVRASRDQADEASGANRFARQVGQSEAVIHFSGRYFDLMRQGPQFGDPSWEYQFWSLHATQFYFFDNHWIPKFMYQLWMVELTARYGDAFIRESHDRYLQSYSANYAEMCDFFEKLQDIGKRHNGDSASRNRKVANVVDAWPGAGSPAGL